MGAWIGVEIWRLADLTATVQDSGYAIASAGQALQSLEAVPVVGERAAELGAEARANAEAIVQDAQAARGAFRRVAVLLGVAVALVPSAPMVALRVALRPSPQPG